MTDKDTVTVDGEQYIFPPDQIGKTQENTENNIIWENGETQ